ELPQRLTILLAEPVKQQPPVGVGQRLEHLVHVGVHTLHYATRWLHVKAGPLHFGECSRRVRPVAFCRRKVYHSTNRQVDGGSGDALETWHRLKRRCQPMNDDFASLYAFNAWANNKMLDACRKLSPEQYAAEPVPGWAPIRSTVYHIVVV